MIEVIIQLNTKKLHLFSKAFYFKGMCKILPNILRLKEQIITQLQMSYENNSTNSDNFQAAESCSLSEYSGNISGNVSSQHVNDTGNAFGPGANLEESINYTALWNAHSYSYQLVPNPFLNIYNTNAQTYNSNMYYSMYYPQYTTHSLSYLSVQQDLSRRYFHRRHEGIQDISTTNSLDTRMFPLRKWEKIERKKSAPKPGFIFTLMSYNVLAQDLLEQYPYIYSMHNPNNLQWERRWQNIYKEIQIFKPDILCLQEVQKSHIQDYYSQLESLGYKGIYKKQTGKRTDGCAIYYKIENVTLVQHIPVELYQPNVSILNRHNVGIVAKFVPKMHPTREFVVATTHLLYNPRRDDVRLAQMQVFLTEIERLSYNKKNWTNSSYLPVLLTGDLNSPPDSHLYKFITSGLTYDRLSSTLFAENSKSLLTATLGITDSSQHVDLVEKREQNKQLTFTEESELISLYNSDFGNKTRHAKEYDSSKMRTGYLSHSFTFKSVYEHGVTEINEGTTFQDEWLTVDYIFYSTKSNKSEDKIQLLSRYTLPTRNELKGVRIPNRDLGSDHVSLASKFKLCF